MNTITRVSLVVVGALLSLVGAYLCYFGKPGWGWFLFAGFLVIGGASFND